MVVKLENSGAKLSLLRTGYHIEPDLILKNAIVETL